MGHFEDVLATILTFSPLEKVRLMEQIATSLEHDLELAEPRSPFYFGMWADLGPAPSAEDIDEVRREVWKNFPREDIVG